MLTPLDGALAAWTPGARPATDPLGIIRGAWPSFVGADVARAAQPVALTGSALVVVTTSASWSHQLAFLERDILGAVRALGVTGIERLRFRVGAIRVAPAAGAGAQRARLRGEGANADRPRSLTEAMDRLRAVIDRSRARHAAGGGAFCLGCAVAIGAGRRCRPCADSIEADIREQTERILFDAPWLSADEVFAAVPGLSAGAYDAIRRRLLRRWIDELRLARKRAAAKAPIDTVRVRKLASSYVLLETRIDPNRIELDSPVRRNALGDLYDFIHTVEVQALGA